MASQVVGLVAALLIGLFTGGMLFALAVPSLRAISGPSYAEYWDASTQDLSRSMRPYVQVTMALTALTAVLSWQRPPRLVLSIVALALMVGMVVLIVRKLEPLNAQGRDWAAHGVPGDWEQVRDRWYGYHRLRCGLALGAFACLLTAQLFPTA